MAQLFDIIFTPQFFFGVLRLATPILFASLAAVIGSAYSQSVIVGVLSAVITGIVISLLLAYSHIKMETDVLLAAIAINLLAAGATIFILFLVSGERGTSSALESLVVPSLVIPSLMNVPILGNVILGQNYLVYTAFLSVLVVYIILYKTPLGLRIRAVGGNPGAAESVGVSVEKTRYIALLLSGILSGLGGAFMTMGYMSIFTNGMIAGRGFIGLAAANVGGQNPIGALFASLLFGLFDTLGNNLQNFRIPVEFIYMVPYVTTIIAYAATSYRKEKSKIRKQTEDQLAGEA